MIERFPKYGICRHCTNRLNQACLEDCIRKDDLRWFKLKPGVKIEDLSPFPMAQFENGMPAKVRQVVVSVYVSKIIDYLQGKEEGTNGHPIHHPRSCKPPQNIKKQTVPNGATWDDPTY